MFVRAVRQVVGRDEMVNESVYDDCVCFKILCILSSLASSKSFSPVPTSIISGVKNKIPWVGFPMYKVPRMDPPTSPPNQ